MIRNSQKKTYVNGLESDFSDFGRAKDALIKAGLYRKLGNFGPFYPNKLKREFSVVETFVLDGFEFTVIESEVMSLSFDLLTVSQPHKQLEAWFQPVTKN